jgi:uncharacterized repeat protein (TIGR03803 family)
MRKINGRFGVVARITASMGMMLAAAIAAHAQMFTTLTNFSGGDGTGPYASLVQGTDGNLYGITNGGGTNGYGTVFRVTPVGVLTTLYSFCAQPNCIDGGLPYGGLVLGTDGNLYGTTYLGGGLDKDCGYRHPGGCGTVFKITLGGVLTTLHRFAGYPTDGDAPTDALVQGTDGNFYGTAAGGAYALGTVFEITPEGTLTTLYNFDDGADPYGGLVQAADGSLYGTTYYGGQNNCFGSILGCGTVFKITSAGVLTTLTSFAGYPTSGSGPYPTMARATDGNFYGTTHFGGANSSCSSASFGCGTAFKITTEGTLTTLYNFCSLSECVDGAAPYAPLVQATDGNLYGAANGGGAITERCFSGCGTVFKLVPGDRLTTLHSFDWRDGSNPIGGLVQATNGILYGTTAGGGTNKDGTVFSVDVGLGPFVKTLPTARRVGQWVAILGSSLTGATSVTFNGIPAKFSVISSTEIATTVPTGAATGPVQVVTPSGTLTSNVHFQVEP